MEGLGIRGRALQTDAEPVPDCVKQDKPYETSEEQRPRRQGYSNQLLMRNLLTRLSGVEVLKVLNILRLV